VILTSGLLRERVGDLPLGVDYMPKPWQPLDVLIAASGSRGLSLLLFRILLGPVQVPIPSDFVRADLWR
jgi:hypothetical protein